MPFPRNLGFVGRSDDLLSVHDSLENQEPAGGRPSGSLRDSSEGGQSKDQAKLDESRILTQLATENLNARKFNEALELFSEAIKFTPNVGINYYYRGVCKINLRKFTDAKKDIEIACIIDPTFVMPDILNGYRFRFIALIENYLAWWRRLRFR